MPESDEGETKDSDGGAPSTSVPPAPLAESTTGSKSKKSKKSKKKRKKKATSGHSSVWSFLLSFVNLNIFIF
jgi:hypothetical protein